MRREACEAIQRFIPDYRTRPGIPPTIAGLIFRTFFVASISSRLSAIRFLVSSAARAARLFAAHASATIFCDSATKRDVSRKYASSALSILLPFQKRRMSPLVRLPESASCARRGSRRFALQPPHS